MHAHVSPARRLIAGGRVPDRVLTFSSRWVSAGSAKNPDGSVPTRLFVDNNSFL